MGTWGRTIVATHVENNSVSELQEATGQGCWCPSCSARSGLDLFPSPLTTPPVGSAGEQTARQNPWEPEIRLNDCQTHNLDFIRMTHSNPVFHRTRDPFWSILPKSPQLLLKRGLRGQWEGNWLSHPGSYFFHRKVQCTRGFQNLKSGLASSVGSPPKPLKVANSVSNSGSKTESTDPQKRRPRNPEPHETTSPRF